MALQSLTEYLEIQRQYIFTRWLKSTKPLLQKKKKNSVFTFNAGYISTQLTIISNNLVNIFAEEWHKF